MTPLEIAGLIGSGVSAAQGLYGAFTNERDYAGTKANIKLAHKREDNAVQRRVADLKAAGLNPLLAVGSAASSAAPIRAGGVSSGDIDVSGPVLRGAVVDLEKKMVLENIENARAQRTLILNQAAKTEAEKEEVAAHTALLREQAPSTAAQTALTLKNVDVADQTIREKVQKVVESQAATQKISVETALKELEKRVLARDTQIIEDLGIMKKPPSGVTGQVGQAAAAIFDKAGKAIDWIKSKFGSRYGNYKVSGGAR